MACSLTDDGLQCSAKTGSQVTVKVISSATNLVSAQYNDQDVPVSDNSMSFAVVAGVALLLLNLAGPEDSVEIVEDCGGGQTQHLFGYDDDFHPVLGFSIMGT